MKKIIDFLKMIPKKEKTFALIILSLALGLAYSIPIVLLDKNPNPLLHRGNVSKLVEPGILGGQATIDPNDAFTTQALGNYSADEILRGDIPYWNHYEGIGVPLAGEMQSAALFPLTPLLHFYNGIIIFHFLLQLLAGFTTFLFLRKLGLKPGLALIGGILFELSGAFAWLTNAPFNPIAFLPMLLWGIELALEKTKTKKYNRGWIVIALAIALSLYSGFPETAYLNALFAGGWGLVRLWQIEKNRRKKVLVKLCLGGIVGVFLAAPVLIAFISYLPDTVVAGHEGGGYANTFLSLTTVPALVMPYIFGPIFGAYDMAGAKDLFIFWSNVGGYVTALLVFLGLLGLFAARWPRSLRIFLALSVLVILLKDFGFQPVNKLVNLIPGVNQIAFYRYSVAVLCFALLILAMFALDGLSKRQIENKKLITTGLVCLAAVGLLALYSRGLLHKITSFASYREWAMFAVGWAILSITIVLALFLFRPKYYQPLAMAIIVFDSFLMFTIPFLSIPKMAKIDYSPIYFLQNNLGFSRFYTLGPISPNYGSYFDTASININDLPVPEKWAEHIKEKLDKNSVPILFTGFTREDPNGPTATEEFGRNIAEYENLSVKYLVTEHSQLDQKFIENKKLRKVFESELMQIYSLPNPKGYFEITKGSCSLSARSRDELKVDCASDSTLLRRELSLPGWAATVNGKKVNVETIDDIFQKIEVPKGSSQVKYIYNPPNIIFGYVLLGAGLIVMVFDFARSSKRS